MKRTFDNRQQSESNNDDSDISNKSKIPKLDIQYQDKYQEKINKVNSEILNREINMNNIFDLDLGMNDNIWFSEHFQILRNTDRHTEAYYNLKNKLYHKYINLKSVDSKKLDQIKVESGTEYDIVSKILNSDHPDTIKIILYRKYKRCSDNLSESGASDEYFKVIEWIENVLDLPAKINIDKHTVHDKLVKLWKSLNENISGLMIVKEKLMETMCAKLLDPQTKGNVLLFVGPPGVGKTIIANSISEALNMPFDQISFGSVKDSSILTGHSSTYIGAIPGLFTKILLKSKRLDTVVLLDEIDKIPNTPEGKSISSVLLHVLDRTQNHRFKDMYMPEISLDLSKLIFLAAANSSDDIDPILKDRMTVIEFPEYTIDDKIEIVNNHMLPKIKNELKFGDDEIVLKKSELTYLILDKTRDQPGMRDIERKIYQLCSRLSLLKHGKGINFSYKMSIKFPCIIDNNIIDKLLD